MSINTERTQIKDSIKGPYLFNARLFWWSFIILAITAIIFDVIWLKSYTLLWPLIWIISHGAMGLVGMLFNVAFLNKMQLRKPSGAFNIVVAMVLVGIRLVVTGILSMQLGLEENVNLVARFITGMLMGVAIFYFLNSIFTAIDNSRKVGHQFLAAEQELIDLRNSAQERVQQAQEELDTATRNAINPEIKKLINLLDKKSIHSENLKDLVPQIRSFLEYDVRPLSHELRKQASRISTPSAVAVIRKPRFLNVPKRFVAAEVLRPGFAWAAMALIYMFVPYLSFGVQGLFTGLLLSLVFGSLLTFYKALLPKEIPRRRIVAVTQLIVATLMPALGPAIIVLSAHNPVAMSQIFVISTIPIAFITNAGMALGASQDYERNKYLLALKNARKDLERELALLDQKIWVHRRNWAMVIHGSVQGSLTAAYSRLMQNEELDKNQIKLVRDHLMQAQRAMDKPLGDAINIEKSLDELVSTWKGVVEINLDLAPDVLERIKSDSAVAVCVNQILKETVGNSVKHGQAKHIDISVSAKNTGYLDITSIDDGKGLEKQFTPGLGSQIFDEICTSWSLKKEGKSGKVKLSARIPIQIAHQGKS